MKLRQIIALLGVEGPAPPSDELAFHTHASALTARNTKLAALFMVVANLVWWPADGLVFRHLPGLSARFGAAHLIAPVGPALAYLLLRYSSLARRPLVVAFPLAALQSALLGYFLGLLGDLDTPWFHFSYVVILCSSVVVVPLVMRVALTPVFAAFLLLGFAFSHRFHLAGPLLLPTLSFLLFATLLGVLSGHINYLLVQQSYFAARAEWKASFKVKDLNDTLEQRVRAQTRELRRLASHLETAREDERTRISRELHDELGQELTALRYALTFTRQRYERDPSTIRGNLGELDSLLARTSATTRHIVAGLRPRVLDELGLEASLEWLVRQTQERAGIDCHFTAASSPPDLDESVSVAAFRILQESLTNVIRHARASQVDVVLSLREGELHLAVRDDGVGVPITGGDAAPPPGNAGMGIIGMRERAEALGGRLRLESTPNGTALHVTLPTSPRTATERAT
jgi:signal transduction histidine kinase